MDARAGVANALMGLLHLKRTNEQIPQNSRTIFDLPGRMFCVAQIQKRIQIGDLPP
jgi:hypothetical protein